MNFKNRPEWERCTIVPPPTNTCHIKKTIAVCCMTKTLYGVLTHSFLIHSFSTIAITLFTTALIKISVCLYSTLYLLLSFHKVTSGFSMALKEFQIHSRYTKKCTKCGESGKRFCFVFFIKTSCFLSCKFFL